MIHWLMFACLAVFETWVLRRLRFGWFMVALVLASTLVSVDYLSYTPLDERNYDGPAHAEYIRSIAEDLRLPPPLQCMVCGHPPLYHVLAALWSRGMHAGTWMPRDLGLQCFSLLLSFGFFVFALLLLRSFIQRPATLGLASALVVFWPSTIINSVRVHNDALASLLMMAAIYFVAQWDRQTRPRHFYAAVVACALALLTKASGYAVSAPLLLFAAARLRSTRFSRESVKLAVVATLVLAGAATLAVSLRRVDAPLSTCQKVLGRACDVHRKPPPPSRPIDFVGFDPWEFLSTTDSLFPESEEGYVLNRLLKSSLFGIIPLGKDFADTRHKVLGVIISVSLLAMLVLGVATLAFVRPLPWSRYRVLVCMSAAMLLFLLAFRIRLPNPFHEDLRHIFPVLVPMCLVYAKAVEHLGRRSRVLYGTGLALALIMMVSSAGFFLRL